MSQEIDTPKLSNKLFNATQIAFLISIILHLLIYKYKLPQFMMGDKKVAVEGTVGTIELSPLEAARLPNLETSLAIPDFNSSSLDGTVSPFAFPSSITPVPGTFPDLPPVPLIVPSNFNLQNLPFFPPVTNIELPPIGDISALPLPPPIEELESETSGTSTTESPSSEIEEPAPAKSVEIKPEPQLTPEEIAVVRQEKLEDNLKDISSSLKKQNRATTDEDARKNYLIWLSKVKTVEPEVIEIEGTYPRDACIRRLEGESVYGVIADSKDVVVALELIKSAEYPIFNRQAQEDIRNKNFGNDAGGPKPYRVTVNYQYDAEICPSLTVPSLRKKTETAQPVPTPEAKPKPVPIPEAKPQPTPTPEAKPKPKEKTSLPSLRERLQNAPLIEDNSIRERLRKNPLPKKE